MSGHRSVAQSPLLLIVTASAWMATVGNLALWREFARLQLGGGFALGMALLIGALLTALLAPLAWRPTLKPALVVLLLGSAAGLHFMLAYNVAIDPSMLGNVAQTDRREVADLIGVRLIATVLLLGVVPAVMVWRRPVVYGAMPRRLLGNLAGFCAATLVLVLGTLALFQPLSSASRNHKPLRYLVNPLNSVYAAGWQAVHAIELGRRPVRPLAEFGRDAEIGPAGTGRPRPPLLVLVVGETGRSGNFGLNGYPRPTTPELEREAVVSQRNAWSCGTSTAASLPCMFSSLGKTRFESRQQEAENLLDVLQHAGLAVIWLDNQSGCKSVCARTPSASTASASSPLCDADHECLDGVLLDGLDERLAALPADRRARGVVVVLHPIGSHGPAYSRRSPAEFKRFLPECTSVDLSDCSQAQIVNAYDNSIAYTDHFLAATIHWLRAHESVAEPALVYVADHGESLGENNLYLHGMPYAIAPDVQKRVPWITWMSPAFKERAGVDTACLRRQIDQPVSHDHYFHSVLGLLDVRTSAYERRLDLYADCSTRRTLTPDEVAGRAAGLSPRS